MHPLRQSAALFFLILLFPARATLSADSALPDGALGKAQPFQHYREIFQLAQEPSEKKHKFLENLVFHCEVATFNPIVYNRKNEMPSHSIEQRKKFGHVFKGSSFIMRKITRSEVHYAPIPDGTLKDKSNYENLDAATLKKDKHGGFTNVTKTDNYPVKRGSALFFVEMRITHNNEVVFETSYDIRGYAPVAERKKPVSPGGRSIGSGMFVDDYAVCTKTGELVF